MHHRRVGGFIGADCIVLDRLAGAVFHQRHMLMRRGVVDDLRAVGIKDLEHPPAVPHGPDEHYKVQVRIPLSQLQLDIVGVVLVDVEDDQLPGRMCRDLSAQLAADGAASSGDQDRLAVDKVIDLVHVRPDRFSPEQVFDRDLLHGADGDLSEHQLIQSRELLHLAACFAADVQDIPLINGGCAGDCQVDLRDVIFFNVGHDIVPAAHDGHSVDIPPPFVRIIVYDADDFVIDLCGRAQVAQQQLAGGACTDHHDSVCSLILGASHGANDHEQAVRKPRQDDEHELEQRAPEVVGQRHPGEQDGDGGRVKGRHQQRGCQCPDQFRIACKAPHAPIQPEDPEHDDAQDGIGDDESLVCIQISGRDLGESKIKPAPERQKIGEMDRYNVVQHQQHCHHLPVLQSFPSCPLCHLIPFHFLFPIVFLAKAAAAKLLPRCCSYF